MKIGISTRGIEQGSYAISEMIKHIVDNLLDIDSDHEFFLYSNRIDYVKRFSSRANIRVYEQNNRLIFDQFWLPSAFKKDNVDISLFFKGTTPLISSVKSSVVINDMGRTDVTHCI